MLRFKWHQTHTNEIKRLCYFLLIRQNLKCLVVLVNVSKDVLLLKHPVLRVMELSMSSIWVNVGDCSKIICTCRFRTNAKCNTLSDQLHAFVIKLVQNCALCMWRPLLRGKKNPSCGLWKDVPWSLEMEEKGQSLCLVLQLLWTQA